MSNLPEPNGLPGHRINLTAVIGMGTMGSGIARALIQRGVAVAAVDADPAALARGVARIRASLRKDVERGRLAADRCEHALGLLTAGQDLAGIARADLVIEAVFEEASVKRGVLAAVEDLCSAETVIATNTSTISLDVLAQAMRRPERLIGLHFFNPAHHMPLVELIRREATPVQILATAVEFLERIGKTAVLVGNREGFLVNRVFVPYLKEAFWLLEEGVAPEVLDAAMVEFGFRMGPLAVSDMVGLDILTHMEAVMGRAFAWHGPLSQIVLRLVEKGQLGQKTGAGVYGYEPGDFTPHPSTLAQQVISTVQQQAGRTRRPCQENITRRLVLRMVAEAFRVLEEGLVAGEADVDAATVLGAGFPDFRGGVVRYARDLGLDAVRAELEALTQQCGPRYEPRGLLKRGSGSGVQE